MTYDIAVIGAGVVGAAIARELAATDRSVVLLEAGSDIGDGTSKANSALLHTGYDEKPGSLETRLVVRGFGLLRDYAARTGIAVENTGALLVAWDDEQLANLPVMASRAVENTGESARELSPDQVYARMPALGPGVRGGLLIEGESIIDPWAPTLAYVSDGIARGMRLRLRTHVETVTPGPEHTVLSTNAGDVTARWVVNAAGQGADHIDHAFGFSRFHVSPRRGEFIVFDKLARPLAPHILMPVPTIRGKGVLVTPTVFGNVMLGPTSEDVEDRTDKSTSESGLAGLLEKGRRLIPDLVGEQVTATYAGLRAATEHSDYVVDADPDQRYVCLGGIRSTGLTSSLAVAEYVRDLMATAGCELDQRSDLPAPVEVPNLGEAFPRPYADASLIERDAEYGRTVCFCERVTAGEVRDAMQSAVPPPTPQALRRRTRAVMGRCQGFYCGAEVERLFAEGKGGQ